MNYWLMKTEPGTYSWADLAKDKKATWDGVRNFQARNNLKKIQKGDLVLIYHSGEGKDVVGIAQVVREHFPDPADQDWVAVEIAPEKKLKNPVTLSQVKGNPKLAKMVLVNSSRLSVQPVTKDEFEIILDMGK